MPKLNIDEQTQLAEPIELRLDGKDYVVKKVTTQMIKQVTDLGKTNDISVLVRQMAIFTGAEEKEFENLDIRQLSKALEFIQSSIEEGILKPKN